VKLHWSVFAVVGFVLLVALNVARERVFGPAVDPDDPLSGPSAVSLLMQYAENPARAQRAFGGKRVYIETALVESVNGHTALLSAGPSSPGRISAAFSWLASAPTLEAGDLVNLICTVDGPSPSGVVVMSGCRKASR
jgi:hypothetical protein